MRIILTIILLITLSYSCTNSKDKAKENDSPTQVKKPTQTIQTNFEAGGFYEDIRCQTNSSYSYALYLPGKYNDSMAPSALLPVVYFFDSHARGSLPVRKYQAIADEMGIMLVASNQIKNGMNLNQLSQASMHMIRDIKQRFPIQKAQQFTCGFSGGARVAVRIAEEDKEIIGAIGFGAGLPSSDFAPSIDFKYVFAAGKRDFNYTELLQLDKNLSTSSTEHLFIRHEGTHEWPNDTIFKTALYYLLIKSYSSPTDSLIDAYKAYEKENIRLAQNENDMVKQVEIYQRMSNTLNEFQNTLEEEQITRRLIETKQFHNYQLYLEKAKALETEKKALYKENLYNNDTEWWNKEINQILYGETHAAHPEMQFAYSRLKGFLGIATYMYLSNAMQNNQLQDAQSLLFIYEKVEPENPEVYFLKAVYYARQKNHNLALLSLEEAVKYGFNEMNRVYQESAFEFSELELDLIREGLH
jgi:dienelactone hydrolase